MRLAFKNNNINKLLEISDNKIKYIEKTLNSPKIDEELFDKAGLDYLEMISMNILLGNKITYNKNLAVKILHSIPPLSDLWGDYKMSSVYFGASKVLNMVNKKYIDTILFIHPNPEARKNLIIGILQYNQNRDTSEFNYYYDKLLKMNNLPNHQRIIEMFTPNASNIGKKFEGIQFKNLQGDLIDFNPENMEFYLLVFWATYCSPCIQEIPHLKEIYSKVDTNKINFLFVTIDDKIPLAKKIINEKFHKKWEVLFVDKKSRIELEKKFNVKELPRKMIINSSSIIIKDYINHFEVEKCINTLFSN